MTLTKFCYYFSFFTLGLAIGFLIQLELLLAAVYLLNAVFWRLAYNARSKRTGEVV